VAARPASGQMRSFNPIGYAPAGAFGALQPAAAAAYAAPFGYGLGQPAGMPSSIYAGMPQVGTGSCTGGGGGKYVPPHPSVVPPPLSVQMHLPPLSICGQNPRFVVPEMPLNGLLWKLTRKKVSH